MIEAGEVGARFTILDGASPVLREIAAWFDKTQAAVDRFQASIKTISIPVGLNRSLTAAEAKLTSMADSTKALTGNFYKIDEAMAGAASSMSAMAAEMKAASRAGAEMAALSYGGGGRPPSIRNGRGGGGEGHGGGGFGVRPPPVGAGGFHLHGSTSAMVGAGAIAYGVYEEAEMQDAIFQLLYHTGLPNTAGNKSKFRNLIQDAMSDSGFSFHDIAEASKTEARMFKGTPGNGIDVLPEMLRAAGIEARLKGSSLEESMTSLIGLAHMTKQYDPAAIRKLAPAFAFLSASNPSSLSSMERAAGYAVPILQSGLEIDPMSTLLMGTVLTRAGITSTKSGTWLRNMFQNALPGTSTMSKTQFKKHEDALRSLGLVDGNDKPTWFTDGKPDAFKMLDIASAHAASMDLVHRAAEEKVLFGVQGEGAFSILSDPAIRKQVTNLKTEMNSGAFKNRYASFSEEYTANSPVQKTRKAWADMENVLMDIGQSVLPPLTSALSGFDVALKAMRSTLGADNSNAVVTAGLGASVLAWLGRAKIASWLGSAGKWASGLFSAPLAGAGGAAWELGNPSSTLRRYIEPKISAFNKSGYNPLHEGDWNTDRAYMLGLQYARQAEMHPIIRGERDMEAARARAMSSPAFAAATHAPSVAATLQATVNTTVPFTVQIDGQTVANAIMPKITQMIQQAMHSAMGQLMGHTNEIAAYHPAGIGHN